jgi:molecular chaperone Hsp33
MTQPSTDQPAADRSQRFLFEQADLRGEIVQLDRSFADILALHQYAPGVGALMGEFLAAAVLLSTTLKFEGRLILQARSNGQLPLLMAECSSDLGVRGIARGAQEATSERFDQLLEGGQLAITIDPVRGKRYQGVVPLDGDALAPCLDAYFEQSEQLRTRLWLATDGQRASGMLLQQLPPKLVSDTEQRDAHWQHVTTLAGTVAAQELLQLAPEVLLHRLFHEEPVRLFEPRPVRFQCTCSRERTLGALRSLGAEEVESILTEQGSVTMDCEFCNTRYTYIREDLEDLLGPPPEQTLH